MLELGSHRHGQRQGYAAGIFPPLRFGLETVTSRVTAADLRALPGVVGVEQVAAAGAPPSDTACRVANLTLAAASAEDLDRLVPQCQAALARLFAADLPLARSAP